MTPTYDQLEQLLANAAERESFITRQAAQIRALTRRVTSGAALVVSCDRCATAQLTSSCAIPDEADQVAWIRAARWTVDETGHFCPGCKP